MKVHHVKSWPTFFSAIRAGTKKHDLRDNDRNYEVGDIVVLREFDPATGEYTGATCRTLVTYITSRWFPCALSSAVLNKDFCILSLDCLDDAATEPEPTPTPMAVFLAERDLTKLVDLTPANLQAA